MTWSAGIKMCSEHFWHINLTISNKKKQTWLFQRSEHLAKTSQTLVGFFLSSLPCVYPKCFQLCAIFDVLSIAPQKRKKSSNSYLFLFLSQYKGWMLLILMSATYTIQISSQVQNRAVSVCGPEGKKTLQITPHTPPLPLFILFL